MLDARPARRALRRGARRASRRARTTSPTTATSSKPTSKNPAPATTTRRRTRMLDYLVARSVRHRWLVLLAVAALAAFGAYNYLRLHDRRRARHHERAGADQHRSAGLLAARGRAAHHVRDRDGDGGPAAARLHALGVALRPVAGHGRVRGRHRHLLRAPARRRAAAGSARRAAAGPRARARPDRDGLGRDLQVHPERRARRAARRRHRRTTRPTCTPSWTGSCGRSSRACPASPRST